MTLLHTRSSLVLWLEFRLIVQGGGHDRLAMKRKVVKKGTGERKFTLVYYCQKAFYVACYLVSGKTICDSYQAQCTDTGERDEVEYTMSILGVSVQ